MYQLYPPIFIVPEEHNFADSWEMFCCKMLNVENKISSVMRRVAPESGVDLYDADSKTAYQCKSIDNGLTAGFNLTLIKRSYHTALTLKEQLDWKTYVVCINIDLTGNQYENFRRELPDALILPHSHWLSLCQKHPSIVQENFRKIVPIPKQTVEQRISDAFIGNYPEQLRAFVGEEGFDLLFYSNRHQSVYRIPVSKKFRVGDLIDILRRIFNLPTATTDDGVQMAISYAIVLDDKKLGLSQTIEQAGLDSNSIVTFWLGLTYSNGNEKASSMTMQMLTINSWRNNANRVEDALDRYKARIKNAFVEADSVFSQN